MLGKTDQYADGLSVCDKNLFSNPYDPFRRLEVLADENRLLLSGLAQVPVGIALINRDMQIIFCNRKMREGLDMPESLFEQAMPTAAQFLFYAVQQEKNQQATVSAEHEEALILTKMDALHQYKTVQFAPFKNGSSLCQLCGSPVEEGGYLMLLSVLSEAGQAERGRPVPVPVGLDMLTGLPMLEVFLTELNDMLQCWRFGQVAALHCLDLDHFAEINHAYGRDTGDKVIKEVSQRLRQLVRATDRVARIGGDRFVILQSHVLRPSDVTKLDLRIIDEIRRPYEIDGHEIGLKATIGLALAPRDGMDARSLLAKAEADVRTVKVRKPSHQLKLKVK